MKKNITINMCGRLYAIDEDAYQLMSHYLETLRSYFNRQDGGDEICNDIEQRMAELFDELKGEGVEAITIEHVQDIIKRIGDLKDIIPDGEQPKGEKNGFKSENNNGRSANNYFESLRRKTFYRDTQNGKLAGVLAGCANYFGGPVIAWRVIYVVLVFFNFGLLSAFGSLLFRSVLMGPTQFGLSLPILSFNFILVILYIVVAVIAPEARRPEERLKMKGEPVNPQRLAEEVTQMNQQTPINKDSLSALNIIGGIFFIACAIGFGFMLVALIVLAISGKIGSEFISNHFDAASRGVYEAVHVYLLACVATMIANVGIVEYCCIHGASSSFHKVKSMSVGQRIVWVALWILTLVATIVLCVTITCKAETIRHDINEKQAQEYRESHTHDGIYWNRDEDWDYFRREGWTLVENENCVDHFTQTGQYFTGDNFERYLDAYNGDCGIVYTAERSELVEEPGRYRLCAAARVDAPNSVAIYLIPGMGIKEAGENEQHIIFRTVPSNGDQGGNIWQWAHSGTDSELLPAEIQGDSTLIYDIACANSERGYGWNYIRTDEVIEITAPTQVYYGITTEAPGLERRCTYLSARDFKLEKIN